MIILVTVFQTPTMETRSGHFSNYLSFFSKLWYGGNRRKNLDLSLKQMMRLREYVQGCVYSAQRFGGFWRVGSGWNLHFLSWVV